MVEQFDPLDDEQPAASRGRAAGDGLLDLPLGGEAEPPPPAAEPSPPAAKAPPPPPWQPRHRRRRRRRAAWPWLLVLLLMAGAAAAWRFWPRGEPALIASSVAALDFDGQRIGAAGEPLELILANDGERPLRVRRLEVVGESAALFTVAAEACVGRPVAGGETCRVAVEYRPTESGSHSAALRVVARAVNGPLELPLSGVAVAPRLDAEPAALDFEPLPVGGRSAAREVRLASVGDAPVSVAAVELAGPAAGDYRLERDRCSSRELAAGAGCELRVAFAPAAEGTRRAELRVASDAVGGVAAVALAGAGLPAPEVALEPSRLAFDDQLVGGRSSARRLTLRNRGAAALQLGALAVSGDSFTVAADRCSSRSLAAGAACTIELTFAPDAEGGARGRVELPQAGGTGISWQAELSGTAVAPRPEWSAGRLDWGESRVAEAAGARRLRLRNAGSGTLEVDRLRLTGADAAAFALAADGCSGRRLARGQGCDLELGFRPARLGGHRAALTIAGVAGGDGQVELAGAGVAGRLEPSAGSLEFGSVRVSEAGGRELELVNGGNAELVLRGFSAGGATPEDYRLSGDCRVGATLAPGSSCRVQVTFAPLAAGGRLATLEIAHDGVDSPTRVALSGAALPPPPAELRVEPARLEFGDVAVGGRSEILSLTLSNVGRGRLRLRGIGVEGAQASEFRLVPGTCEGIPFLAPGGRCGVGVRFLPAAGGARRAVVRISHDAPGGDRSVTLSGNGLASSGPR